ncbi:MAG: PspC domain-containing protein [Anaerolineaceae bacterium]|jgi:phage shock protein PspC (stress-responsive transcriptional regulator)
MENRLYRSKTDVILGGVCSGLGKYLGIDPTLVRLFFVLISLAGGVGVLAYLVMWIVIPQEQAVTTGAPGVFTSEGLGDRANTMRNEFVDAVSKPNPKAIKIIGLGLVIYGGYLILKQFHLPWLSWLTSEMIWAGLLILAGIVLILRFTRKDQ